MIWKARAPDAFKCAVRALKKEIFGFSFDYPLHIVPESSAQDSLHYHLYGDALAWEALRLDPSGIPESLMRTFNAVATRYPFLDADQFFEANQAAWAEYWPTVEKSSWLGDVDGASLSLEAWRRTLARCGSEDESIATFAFETHRLGRDAYRAFDDVQQLLDYAEDTGIRSGWLPTGLVTFNERS